MTLRLMTIGRLRVGKTTAARHYEQRGALRWHRAELMKRLAHKLIDSNGDVDEILERLFPTDEDTRDEIRHELLVYAASFSYADGPKQHQLYQDVAQIVMEHDSLAFERELLSRMEQAERSRKAVKGVEPAKMILLDDVRSLEAFEFWKSHGFKSLRIVASNDVRNKRIEQLDGALPPEVLHHPSEHALSDVQCDATIKNNGSLEDFQRELDRTADELSSDSSPATE